MKADRMGTTNYTLDATTLARHEFIGSVFWRQIREASVVFAGVRRQVLVALKEVPLVVGDALVGIFAA